MQMMPETGNTTGSGTGLSFVKSISGVRFATGSQGLS